MNSSKKYDDKVKCVNCNSIVLRGQSLVVENKKGFFRLCMPCFNELASKGLKDDYEQAKNDPIVKSSMKNTTDPYEIVKTKEKFIKDVKEGKYGS